MNKPKTELFMLKGITDVEDQQLQVMANAVLTQLFKRRVKHPAELVGHFSAALQHHGFTNVNASLESHAISFRAKESRRAGETRISRCISKRDRLNAVIIGAARSAGLDPRIEDVCVGHRGGNVEGHVNVLPFVHQTGALDKLVRAWKNRSALTQARRAKRP